MEAKEQIDLVQMVRESDEEPRTADVHPDEVENYRIGGWQVAQAEPVETKRASKRQ